MFGRASRAVVSSCAPAAISCVHLLQSSLVECSTEAVPPPTRAASGATNQFEPVPVPTLAAQYTPPWLRRLLPYSWRPDPVAPDFVPDLFLDRSSATNPRAYMRADKLVAVLPVEPLAPGDDPGAPNLHGQAFTVAVRPDGKSAVLLAVPPTHHAPPHLRRAAVAYDETGGNTPPHVEFGGHKLAKRARLAPAPASGTPGGDAGGAAGGKEDVALGDADNILGDNEVLVVTVASDGTRDTVRVPVAPSTPAAFAWYGARLVRGERIAPGFEASEVGGDGDWPHLSPAQAPATMLPRLLSGTTPTESRSFVLCGDGPMPIFRMDIGDQYFVQYLQTSEPGRVGSGVYIEQHTTPHLHVPVAPDAGGYILLGKRIRRPESASGEGSAEAGSEGLHLAVSAFRIPFGYCLYTPPRSWHCDAGLYGRWIVGYTQAPVFETLLLRRPASGVRIGGDDAGRGSVAAAPGADADVPLDLLNVRITPPKGLQRA